MTVNLHPLGKLLKNRIRACLAFAILSPYIEPLLSRTNMKWSVAGSITIVYVGSSSSRITRLSAASKAPSSKFGVNDKMPATSSGKFEFVAKMI